ncbi:MAG TPA: MBOAT family O-acyltransferase [Vicinamibacterales bacterium]|nr:MBOAT family O-acyltransferase [Vicinamibacterales bacterium]
MATGSAFSMVSKWRISPFVLSPIDVLFNSFGFILGFLPAVLLATCLIHRPRRRVIFWTLASWVFYAFAGPWFVLLMMASTVLDFVLAQRIARSESPTVRRAYMITSICFGLGVLGFFKYFNFFLETVNDVAGALHAITGVPTLALTTSFTIVLPAGISFYTFETIRYTVDVYRRNIAPERDFWYFACFVSLFPHLIAGPIIKPGDLLPQLHQQRHEWRWQHGLFLFAAGLCKKVLIADRIAISIDPFLFNMSELSTPKAWMAMVGFAMQIYFDFSGYTDMARGLGYMIGIEFPINFDSPYRALDPSDFWRRWHITLSTWLREYLYIPLGGNRHGRLMTYRNLMITMLLGGLWHGAGWNFVLWGGLHGLALSGYHRFGHYWDPLPIALRRSAMFFFVVLTWVPFRLHKLDDILTCYRAMFALDFSGAVPWRLPVLLIGGTVLAIFVRQSSNDIEWGRLGPIAAVALGVAAFVTLLYINASTQFLYFQF